MTAPTTDPFDLRVGMAITAALKEITPDAGYFNDLSDFVAGDGITTARVYRGREWFGDNDPIPMVSILEEPKPADETSGQPDQAQAGEYDWGLLIQGFVDDDPQNPTDPAYRLKCDVRRRLMAERKRVIPGTRQPDILGFGASRNRITKITVPLGIVRPADDLSAKAYFWLPVRLRIVEHSDDPFA